MSENQFKVVDANGVDVTVTKFTKEEAVTAVEVFNDGRIVATTTNGKLHMSVDKEYHLEDTIFHRKPTNTEEGIAYAEIIRKDPLGYLKYRAHIIKKDTLVLNI